METKIYYPKTYDVIYRSGYIIGLLGIVLFVFLLTVVSNLARS